MVSNCLFFALRKWICEGGYLIVRKSHSGPFPHFLWSRDLKTFAQFTPVNRKEFKPVPPLLFRGYVFESDTDIQAHGARPAGESHHDRAALETPAPSDEARATKER